MPKLCPVCGTTFTDANVFCPKDGSTLRAAELDSDLIGTVVADRYLVTDLLGEGGMGKVYLARHVRLPQQAAIKVLRPAMLRDPDAVARFNREAANASSIEHEHIARVFDYGESTDGTVYLAMEYVPGRTLKKLLATDGPQSPQRTARITQQIGNALDAAHKLGIIHRDLKPDNVMVVESVDSGDKCKVVDFGIAKAVGGDAGEGLTKTGFVVGTPEFMSPEQLMGEAIDQRSDVYALALLTFQCLTGELPFDSSTPERAMTARLMELPKTLAMVKGDVHWPERVQAVLDGGLARDPLQRYESAGRFAREFQQAVATWGGDTTVGLGYVAAITAVLEDSVGTPQNEQSNQPEALRDTATGVSIGGRPSKSRGPLLAGGALGVMAIAAVVWAMARVDGPQAGESSASPKPTAVIGAAPTAPVVEDDASKGGAVGPETETTPSSDTRGSVEPKPDKSNTEPLTVQNRDTTRRTTLPAPQSEYARTDPSRARETSSAALFTLDSIRIALNPAVATETDARRSVAALRDLMPRLATAQDSAWGYLRQAEAHFLMNDELSACVALRAARPLIRDAAQQRILGNFSAVLTVRC